MDTDFEFIFKLCLFSIVFKIISKSYKSWPILFFFITKHYIDGWEFIYLHSNFIYSSCSMHRRPMLLIYCWVCKNRTLLQSVSFQLGNSGLGLPLQVFLVCNYGLSLFLFCCVVGSNGVLVLFGFGVFNQDITVVRVDS